jgi:hypothetical protein
MGEPARLAKEQLRALDRLSRSPEIGKFYLAGGTAIAIHLGHRRSFDLDFFSVSRDVDFARLKAAVREVFDQVTVVGESDVWARLLCDETPIDFVRYPYSPLEPPSIGPSGVALAGLLDLGTMKLAAISKRGFRRDFWDLSSILRDGLTLQQICQAYVRKFGVAEADLYHVLRALTYFDDAEKDPIFPPGLGAAEWEAIKTFFRAEAPKLVLRGA